MSWEVLQEVYGDAEKGKRMILKLASALKDGTWKEDKKCAMEAAVYSFGFISFKFVPHSHQGGEFEVEQKPDAGLLQACSECVHAIDGTDETVSQGPLTSIIIAILWKKLKDLLEEWLKD